MEKINEIENIHKIELEMIKEVDRICQEHKIRYYLAYGTVLGAVRHKGFIPWDTDIDIMVEADLYDEFCQTLIRNLSPKYKLNSIHTSIKYEELFARVGLNDCTHHQIHIDIFPLAGAPERKILKKIFSKIAYINYRSFFVKQVDINFNYIDRPKKKLAAGICKVLLLPIPSKVFKKIYKLLSKKYDINKSTMVCNICGSYGGKEFIPKEYLGNPVYLQFEDYALPVPEQWDKYLTHFYGDYMTPKKENYV